METKIINCGTDFKPDIKTVLTNVILGMEKNGYEPARQLAGYIMSGDPVYITSKDACREEILKVDRNELLEVLLKSYIDLK